MWPKLAVSPFHPKWATGMWRNLSLKTWCSAVVEVFRFTNCLFFKPASKKCTTHAKRASEVFHSTSATGQLQSFPHSCMINKIGSSQNDQNESLMVNVDTYCKNIGNTDTNHEFHCRITNKQFILTQNQA